MTQTLSEIEDYIDRCRKQERRDGAYRGFVYTPDSGFHDDGDCRKYDHSAAAIDDPNLKVPLDGPSFGELTRAEFEKQMDKRITHWIKTGDWG